MSQSKFRMSRRHFLGGSMAAAVGSLSTGLFESRAYAQRPVPPLPLSDLEAPAGAPDEAYWWKVRSQFNLVDGLTFLNNGTEGPMPHAVVEENVRVLREIAEDPTNNYRRDEIDQVRAKVAAFLGANADEIILTRSTSEGMNIFAHGLDWKEGDEVIVNSHEHGGGLGPYRTLEKRKGIKMVSIDVPSPFESVEQIVGLYEKAITPRTRVIMVSHMPYVTGTVMPVKELADLAHQHGALISVDGAHPIGMLNMNFHEMGIDHYAGAGQKWLCAGTGTGIAYIKRDIQDQVWPIMGAPGDPARGSGRYESFGQRNIPAVLGVGKAVEFQETVGKQNIENRDRMLGDRLRKGLQGIAGVKLWTPTDPKLSAGLTLFSVHDIPMENVQKAIFDNFRVYIRTMGTGNLNACRASTHLYNFPHEVDALLEAVKYVSDNASKLMSSAAAG